MTRIAAGIYETVQGDIRLTITDVTAHTGRLDAWVEVHHGKRRLTFGDLNLRGARTVSTLARSCAEAAPALKMPWLEWLGEGVYEAIADTLEGEPPVLLAPSRSQPAWLVDRLVGSVGATSLVGFGETGKSMVALAVACTISSGDSAWLGLKAEQAGPVFYIDYEAGREQHEWRLHQLCRGADRPPPDSLLYRKESMPLARSVSAIARHVAYNKAKLIIVDSVMLARGGDAFGAESTVALYAALSQIGCPALLVDHRAKHANDNGDAGPYGSVANLNSARLVWGAITKGTPEGADIRLKRVKANYHGRLEDHAWQLRFGEQNESARFNRVDPGLILAGGEATMKDRIAGALLRAGIQGLTVKELAKEVGSAENGVRAVLSRLKAAGEADTVGGRWLADSQYDQEVAPF